MRRRFIYRQNERGEVEAVEVSTDFQRNEERQPVFTDRYMEGVRATDGTDIGSRTKRREYMRDHNLADFDDFKGTFEQMQNQRPMPDRGEAKAAVREAIHQMKGRKR